MHRSHRTGRVTWDTNRSRYSVPDATTAPSAFDSTRVAGSWAMTPAAASATRTRPGSMWSVWNAPATESGTTRAPAGGLSRNAWTCSTVPAATIWPAPLLLAAVAPAASIAASTASRSPRTTAAIVVGRSADASAMPRARSRTRATASSGVRTPLIAAAANSPTLCPAHTPTTSAASAGPPSNSAAASTAEATSSGCATAVSRMVSASASVPKCTRSRLATVDNRCRLSAKPGSSSQAFRKPGVWAPCPGATIASTLSAWRQAGGRGRARRDRKAGAKLGDSHKRSHSKRRPRVSPSRRAYASRGSCGA